MKRFLLVQLILFVVQACSPGEKPADLVVLDANLRTMADHQPEAQALAVRNGLIISIGSNEEVENFIGDGTQVLNAEGKLVLPGFIDTHTHAFWGGQRLAEINLNDSESVAELQSKLSQWITDKNIEPGVPVWGVGPFPRPALFDGLGWPDKDILDQAAPNNPVILSRGGGHAYWVNSKALEMAGITKGISQPDGGEIVLDDNGFPTGILKEKAQDLITVAIEHPVDMEENFMRAMDHALSLGLTGITIMPLTTGQRGMGPLKRLQSSGKLSIRVNLAYAPNQLDSLIERQSKTGLNDSLISLGPIKIFMDGSLGALSAFMYEPFADDPGNSGIPRYEKEALNALVLKAHDNDWQVAIHAIGDQAVTWALDAVENAQKVTGKKGLRHRIEHNTVNIEEDTYRFAELEMVASMQPHITGNQEYRERRLGVDRAHQVDVWKTLLERDAMIGWSTDWPVSSLNPIDIIYDIVTRYPEQRLTMEQAIKYYTYGSAYASHDEGERGTLEVGKLADLVVLNQDLFNIPPEAIKNTKVVYTIVNGSIAYQSD